MVGEEVCPCLQGKLHNELAFEERKVIQCCLLALYVEMIMGRGLGLILAPALGL